MFTTEFLPVIGPQTISIDLKAKKKHAPYGWKHAGLGPLEDFIKQELANGNYTPAFPVNF